MIMRRTLRSQKPRVLHVWLPVSIEPSPVSNQSVVLSPQDVTTYSHPTLVYRGKKSANVTIIFKDDAHSCQCDVAYQLLHFSLTCWLHHGLLKNVKE